MDRDGTGSRSEDHRRLDGGNAAHARAIANLTGAIAAAPRRPSSPGPSRTATSIRSVRHAGTLSRRDRGLAPPLAPVARAGYRVSRRHPLTEAALYNDDARPPILAVPKPHHVCSICWAAKSHPVSYLCGDSHCYVCVRLWLEKQWTCPDCSHEMSIVPFRHYGEENSIEYDYPFWKDNSRVSYSFHGLIFPPAPAPAPIILLDIEDSP
ncbi:hypothetical protein B0H14DRAFT_3439097 [Mycena olivaceomarginata]|nr:hypothetical protein B0H14DRAFT_3439097 [Mycena olivaceomarginata]